MSVVGMNVAVIGSGYVGLVSGVGLAEHGHRVVCVDIDPAKVESLNAGRPPIHEEGLEPLLARHVDDGTFRATTDLTGAVAGSDLVLICVGTPSRADGSIDISFVEQAASEVGAVLAGHPGTPAVVVKSTVVPGSTDAVVTPALEKASGRSAGVGFGVGVNPEFLTEGTAIVDFLRPDRIVVGGDDIARTALERLYDGFSDVPLVRTNARTAEMIKYASNTMLATAISFSNEIANLGAAVGDIDTVEVMRGVHLSRYLTSDATTAGLASFYEAGCGYGGSCLPKDVAALIALGDEVGAPMRVLGAVAEVNDDQPRRLLELTREGLGPLSGRRVTVLGIAFKPDTDDVRHSPAFPVLRGLLAEGAEVTAHDPVVGPEALDGLGAPVAHTHDLATALRGAEAVVLVTRWAEYAEVPELIAGAVPAPLVVDGRRVLPPESVTAYTGIGR